MSANILEAQPLNGKIRTSQQRVISTLPALTISPIQEVSMAKASLPYSSGQFSLFAAYEYEKRKTCVLCRTEKPLHHFHKHKRETDGRRTTCRECRREESHKYYETHRSAILAAGKVSQQSTRGRLLHNRANAKYRKAQKVAQEESRKVDPTITRECTQCGETKNATHFYWRRDGKHARLTSRCRECRKLNYKENPQRCRERSKKHYWINKEAIQQGLKEKYILQPERRLLTFARKRAKDKGLPFDLSVGDITIPAVCPVLGIPLFPNEQTVGPNSPTIDRIVGELGYVRGNVVVVSFRANTIKNDATLDDLRRIIAFYEKLL